MTLCRIALAWFSSGALPEGPTCLAKTSHWAASAVSWKDSGDAPICLAWARIALQHALIFCWLGLTDGPTHFLPPSEASFAGLLAVIATLVYEWYIARVALAVTSAQATLVVIIDLLLSTALGRVAESLY